MPDVELTRLRNLRETAETLLASLVSDLRPFRAKSIELGFRRKSDSTPDPGRPDDVSITTTCSCLMGLAHAGKLKDLYGAEWKSIVERVVRKMMKAPWESSGLTENNAFTSALVIRMYGALVHFGSLDPSITPPFVKRWALDTTARSTDRKTLNEIALELSKKIAFLGIYPYPPAAAVVYWFLDGVDHAGFDLRGQWKNLFMYATEEFRRQRSLVVARHSAMMDPVAMAMAACLCARLHSISKRSKLHGCTPEMLPTVIELESSIMDLFAEQTPTGLWPKYFPLFHYKDAGSNFCYTFELLEAVLLEFGQQDNHVLLSETAISGLERAVSACVVDRLESSGPEGGDGRKMIQYNGWNSGGNLDTLRRGQPESWATAVVHMFLRELINALSRHIRKRLLKQYDAKTYDTTKRGLKGLLDIKVHINSRDRSLRKVLQDDFVDSFALFSGEAAENLLGNPVEKQPRSALLFGPPGTSKTEVAKALAASLRWPLVEIDPSHFLRNTFQNIYVQAESIFKDVMDMYGVVVLFDELDALVQTRRRSGSPDTESKFLTTYMLPKLTKLHDQGRLIFLMATNYQENFDEAIKRAGRFDRLLCMGPPTLEEKCKNLQVFLGKGEEIQTGAKLLLMNARKDQYVYDQLTLYTFGEFKSFASQLGNADNIESNLRTKGLSWLRSLVEDDSKTVGMKRRDLEILNDPPYGGAWTPGKWTKLSQLYGADFDAITIKDPTLAVKYILERQQSKLQ